MSIYIHILSYQVILTEQIIMMTFELISVCKIEKHR